MLELEMRREFGAQQSVVHQGPLLHYGTLFSAANLCLESENSLPFLWRMKIVQQVSLFQTNAGRPYPVSVVRHVVRQNYIVLLIFLVYPRALFGKLSVRFNFGDLGSLGRV